MGFSEMMGVKQVKLTLKGNYETIQELFEKIKDVEFEAGKPALIKQGFAWIIFFPKLDRNNQVQILGSKNKYSVVRSTQPAGLDQLLANVALEHLTDGFSGMTAAFGGTKKRCMALVESTAKVINELGI